MPKKNFYKDNHITNQSSLDYFLHLAEESRVFLHKDKYKMTGLEAAFYIFQNHSQLSNKFSNNYFSILNKKENFENIPFEFCCILKEIIFHKKDIEKWIKKENKKLI